MELLSSQISEDSLQVCICFERQLFDIGTLLLADIGLQKKDIRSKLKNLNQSTTTALDQKVRPHMFLTSPYALI